MKRSEFHCVEFFEELWMKEVSYGDFAGSLPWRLKYCNKPYEGLEMSRLGDVSDSSLHRVLK